MKIRPVGAELYHADGRTDMTNLIVAFRSFANAPNKQSTIRNYMDFKTRGMTGRNGRRQTTLFSGSDQYLLSKPQSTAHIYSRVCVVTARLTSERRGSIMPLSELHSPWTLVVRVQSSSSSLASHLFSTCTLRTSVHQSMNQQNRTLLNQPSLL
jgi:hypothetical protein